MFFFKQNETSLFGFTWMYSFVEIFLSVSSAPTAALSYDFEDEEVNAKPFIWSHIATEFVCFDALPKC